MRAQDKTKEDLVNELQELRKEYDALKKSYKKDNDDRKRLEEKVLFINKAIQSTSEAIGISDAQGHHFYQNKALSDLFGYATAEELNAAGGGSAVIKDPEIAKEMFGSIMNGNSWVGELAMVTKGGRVFPAFERADAIKDSNGKVLGLIGIITDISERKRVEAALTVSETRYRRLFETAKDGILILDAGNGMIMDVNPFLIEILGYSKEQFVEKAIWEIGFFKDIIANQDKFLELKQKEYVRYEDLPLETYNGQKINVEFVSNVYIVNSHKVIQCNIRDISKGKRVEEKLHSSEQRFNDIVTNLDEGFYSCTLDGTILEHNIAFNKINGIDTNHDANKINITDFWQNPQQRLEYVDKLMNDGYIRNYLVDSKTMRGEKTVVLVNSHLVKDNNGNAVRIEGTIADFTEHRRAEQLKHLSNEILGILNSPLSLHDKIAGILKAIQEETKFSAVGIRLKKGDDFPYFAQNGFSEDFLLTENTLILKGRDGGICRNNNGNPLLECTCGLVISGKTDPANSLFTKAGSFWTNNSYPLLDIPADQEPRLNPRNNCIHNGFGSLALVPIRTNENIVGLLQLNNKEKEAFTTDMIASFENICSFIGTTMMRLQAEEAVAELSVRYQTLLQNASDGIHILDDQGNVIEANLTFCNMLGYSREEMLKLNVAIWDIQWSGDKLIEKMNELKSQPAIFETRHRRKDGTTFDVEINGIGIIIEGHNYLYASARDITERKRTEKILKENESRYKNLSTQLESILDHIPGPVFYKDRLNNFIKVNKYLADGYKKNKNELEGISLNKLHSLEIAEKYYLDDLSVINSGVAKLNIIELWETADGLKWLSTSKIPFNDNDGEIIGVIGMSIDITELKKAETEISVTNEHLLKIIAEKDKFFSIIAHDLRGPFQTLLGFTRMMVEEIDSLTLKEIQKMALSMRNSATNLYRLLENLLQWSMIQRGLSTFKPKSFLLLNGIVPVIELVRNAADKKEIRITYDVPENLRVMADVQMFESLIRNLVFNAIKFTPKGGEVIISAKLITDNLIEISIMDTGIGMKKDMIDNLFRLDEHTNRKGTEGEPSTGLGLIICKEVIEKHGGQLRVVSEENKGTTLYFTLPSDESLIEPFEAELISP